MGTGCPVPQDRLAFAHSCIWIICGLPSFQGCQSGCLGLTSLPISQLERDYTGRCVPLGSYRPCFLPLWRVYPQNTVCRLCMFSGKGQRQRDGSICVMATLRESFPASLLWFRTQPGSCRPSSSSRVQAADASGTDVWYEQTFRGLRKQLWYKTKYFFINLGQGLQTSS